MREPVLGGLVMMQAKVAIGSSRPGRPEKYTADEVLKTALGLYWTEGVSMLSVNSVARRMGIPKPSLYRHFHLRMHFMPLFCCPMRRQCWPTLMTLCASPRRFHGNWMSL